MELIASRRKKDDPGYIRIGGMNRQGNRVATGQQNGVRGRVVKSPEGQSARSVSQAPVRFGTSVAPGQVTEGPLKSGEYDVDVSPIKERKERAAAVSAKKEGIARDRMAENGMGIATVGGQTYIQHATPAERGRQYNERVQQARAEEAQAHKNFQAANEARKVKLGLSQRASMSPQMRKAQDEQFAKDQTRQKTNIYGRAVKDKYDTLKSVGLANAAAEEAAARAAAEGQVGAAEQLKEAEIEKARLGVQPAKPEFETTTLKDPGKDAGESFVVIDKRTGLPVKRPQSDMSPAEQALEERIAENEKEIAMGDDRRGLLNWRSRHTQLKEDRAKLAELRSQRQPEQPQQAQAGDLQAQAMAWLEANPNHPQAAAVRKKLGLK